MSDVAMDPYSSDGHDGLVENGEIMNDRTLPILAKMAIAQASNTITTRNFLISGQEFTQAEIIDARALPTVDGASIIMVTFSEFAAKRVSAIIKANANSIRQRQIGR